MIEPDMSMESVNKEAKTTLRTTRFGEIDCPQGNIIHMPSGILGFPGCTDYILLPHKKDSPFLWYQSLDDPALAFVVVNPFIFKPDYDLPISPSLMEVLGAEKLGDLEVLTIVTIPRDKPRDMTANLLGPIIVNPGKRLARQIVLDPERYSTKTVILPQRNQ